MRPSSSSVVEQKILHAVKGNQVAKFVAASRSAEASKSDEQKCFVFFPPLVLKKNKQRGETRKEGTE